MIDVPSQSAPDDMSHNFALIGAAGYVAPKHMKAIRDVGSNLVAAVDKHDSVGILDSYFPQTRFFTEIERFDRFLEKSRRGPDADPVEYVSVCTPNYLHDAHVRQALRVGAHAICEKPLVINPWNLDQLASLEDEFGKRIYTVLQLRLHPAIRQLKQDLESQAHRERAEISLSYVTRRGNWYSNSWKGDEEKSGGVAMNIGIHFFDLLLWLFGPVQRSLVHCSRPRRMGGSLELEWATVNWYLSVDAADLPEAVRRNGGHAYRSLTMNGEEIDLSAGFTDLHTEVYRDVLAGGGYGIEDARPSIELVYNVRHTRESPAGRFRHPLAEKILD